MENDTAESQSSHEKKENLHGKALDEVSNRESAAFPQVFASIMEAEMQRWWKHIGCVILLSDKQQI